GVANFSANHRPEQSHVRKLRRTLLHSAERSVGILVKDRLAVGVPDAVSGVLGERLSVTVELCSHHHVLTIRRVIPINLFRAEVVGSDFRRRGLSCRLWTLGCFGEGVETKQRRHDTTCRQGDSSFHWIFPSRTDEWRG